MYIINQQEKVAKALKIVDSAPSDIAKINKEDVIYLSGLKNKKVCNAIFKKYGIKGIKLYILNASLAGLRLYLEQAPLPASPKEVFEAYQYATAANGLSAINVVLSVYPISSLGLSQFFLKFSDKIFIQFFKQKLIDNPIPYLKHLLNSNKSSEFEFISTALLKLEMSVSTTSSILIMKCLNYLQEGDVNSYFNVLTEDSNLDIIMAFDSKLITSAERLDNIYTKHYHSFFEFVNEHEQELRHDAFIKHLLSTKEFRDETTALIQNHQIAIDKLIFEPYEKNKISALQFAYNGEISNFIDRLQSKGTKPTYALEQGPLIKNAYSYFIEWIVKYSLQYPEQVHFQQIYPSDESMFDTPLYYNETDASLTCPKIQPSIIVYINDVVLNITQAIMGMNVEHLSFTESDYSLFENYLDEIEVQRRLEYFDERSMEDNSNSSYIREFTSEEYRLDSEKIDHDDNERFIQDFSRRRKDYIRETLPQSSLLQAHPSLLYGIQIYTGSNFAVMNQLLSTGIVPDDESSNILYQLLLSVLTASGLSHIKEKEPSWSIRATSSPHNSRPRSASAPSTSQLSSNPTFISSAKDQALISFGQKRHNFIAFRSYAPQIELLSLYPEEEEILLPPSQLLFSHQLTEGDDTFFIAEQVRTPLGLNPLEITSMCDSGAVDAMGNNALHMMSVLDRFDYHFYEQVLTMCLDINYQNIDGETALLMAVRYQNMDLISELLASGANPFICDNDGVSIFDYAEEFPELSNSLETYFNECDLTKVIDQNGNTVLHGLILEQQESILTTLLPSCSELALSLLNLDHYSPRELIQSYASDEIQLLINKNSNSSEYTSYITEYNITSDYSITGEYVPAIRPSLDKSISLTSPTAMLTATTGSMDVLNTAAGLFVYREAAYQAFDMLSHMFSPPTRKLEALEMHKKDLEQIYSNLKALSQRLKNPKYYTLKDYEFAFDEHLELYRELRKSAKSGLIDPKEVYELQDGVDYLMEKIFPPSEDHSSHLETGKIEVVKSDTPKNRKSRI